MDLGLSGKTLQSVLIENSIVMQLSDEHFALIASPLILSRNREAFTLTPDEDPGKPSSQSANWRGWTSLNRSPTIPVPFR